MEFNQRLKELMGKQGMTAYRLSQLMACSQSTIGKWLTGETYPQRAKMIQLSNVMNVSLDYLKGESDDCAADSLQTLRDADRALLEVARNMTEEEVYKAADLLATMKGTKRD